MSKNVSSFVSKLEKISDDKSQVYLPSLKKDIDVTSLTIKQQKDLISSSLDGLKGAINFSRTLNKVVLDSTTINDLKIYDRLPIVIGLRKDSLGGKIKSGEEKIDLERIIANIKKIPLEIEDKSSVRYKNLKLNLKVPTLKQENILLNKVEQDIDNESEDLKQGVGLLYIVELLKFIVSLEIDDEVIDFSDIRISERMELVEKLPLSIYNEVSAFIEKINDYNNTILSSDDFELSIDSEFFDSSINE